MAVAVVAVALAAGCGKHDVQSLPLEATEPSPARPTVAAPAGSAAEAARLDAVRRALEGGVDVDAADAEGRTALMMAAFEGHTEVVRLMLEHGASPDLRDGAGRTALMYAASGPFAETVEVLLEGGAGVDLADQEESWTALMFAAGEGQTAVVEVLLRHGADPTQVDDDDEAAADHARLRGHAEVARLLEGAAGGRAP